MKRTSALLLLLLPLAAACASTGGDGGRETSSAASERGDEDRIWSTGWDGDAATAAAEEAEPETVPAVEEPATAGTSERAALAAEPPPATTPPRAEHEPARDDDAPRAVAASAPAEPAGAKAGATAPDATVATRPAEPAPKRAHPVKRAPQPTYRLSPAELSIWKDPRFQRRFAESYLAESDVEPPVTAKEVESVQAVLDAISEDRMDEAAKLLRAKRGPAASAVFDYLLANVLFQQEELDEAAAALQVAVDKYPKFRRAWQTLGMTHFRAGDFGRALPALTRVLELGGGNAVVYGMLGIAYSNTENPLAAETAFRTAILLDPLTSDWQRGLAHSLFRQRRFAEAVALFDTLLAEQPDSAELWLLQANAYIGMEQPLEAAKNYEFVDEMGGSTVASLDNLADIYVNAGLFDDAVEAYLRTLEIEPRRDTGRPIRAARVMITRSALGAAQRLVEGLEAAAGEAGGEPSRDLLWLRSRLAVATGADDEQVRVLERLVELDPLDGNALILLGQHFARTGDLETAASWFERAEKLEDHEADACLRHAQALVGATRYAEAVRLLRRAQDLEPREDVQTFLEQVEQRAAQSR